MAKTWMKYFIIILPISILILIYSSFNVPSSEVKFPGPTIDHSTKRVSISNLSNADKTILHEKCKNINIAIVCAGYSSTQSLITTVKSILFYRSKPLHFHFLVDEISNRTLEMLFHTWHLPQVKTTFYPIDLLIPRVSWIPNKHYSGVYGLLKLIIPDVINEEKVIVLDTDIVMLNDISNLWDIFDDFNDDDDDSKDNMLGLVENQSDWYVKKFDNGQQPWPAIAKGFNTGVMLMHINKLKSSNFNNLWVKITKKCLDEYVETTLADQDIINAVITNVSSIVFTIPCQWNVQLSDHTTSNQCYYSNIKQINVLHWNSPHKQDVRNKHSNDFNQMYRLFLEMNGNLLRRRIFGCEEVQSNQHVNQNDKCDKFIKGSQIHYRTQLFLREYEYNSYIENDVGLVTQCSADRLILLDELCKRWPGTISIAVYLTDAEVQSFLDFIRGSQVLRNRKNIAYHVVYKDGEFYPINYLRNVATSHVPTPFVIQLDIDFLPPIELYEKLMNYIIQLNVTESDKKAFIIPAFETQRYRFTFPGNKDDLLKYLNYGILYTFRYHVWAKGHAATNYTYWKIAVEPYEIEWEPDFEPYIMVSKSSPLYDERFIGFGWNKVSYITHLTALGYRYIVLPDVFIIHRPHAPSLDIGKFRTDVLYRKCLKRLKDKFLDELISKYGENASRRIQKITKD